MASARKRGLGRGLSALISPAAAADAGNPAPVRKAGDPASAAHREDQGTVSKPLSNGTVLIELDPHIIRQNPQQPRHDFREEALEELAESIRRDGILEPVLVRLKDGQYELVSGERRVKASILAERPTIPAILREVSDRDMLKLGLIENIQREDLNAMETALAYQALIDEFKWTQEQLAEAVGKKRATVTNTLRLLQLDREVQQAVIDGAITMGHAKALLSLESPIQQRAACKKIVAEGLSVRQAEKLASPAAPKQPKETVSKAPDPHLAPIEDELRRRFGTKVHVRTNEHNRGKIEIDFFDLDDLDRILSILRR